ncbi:DUF1484 family protein [Cupriavidus sp. CP313]
MQPTTPAPQHFALAQKQAQLTQNLAVADRALARRLARTTLPPVVTLEDHILETSAGLRPNLSAPTGRANKNPCPRSHRG